MSSNDSIVYLFYLFHQDGEEEEFKDLAEEEDDDEEERFVDANKVDEGVSAETVEPKPSASWVHHQNLEGQRAAQIYDPYLIFMGCLSSETRFNKES